MRKKILLSRGVLFGASTLVACALYAGVGCGGRREPFDGTSGSATSSGSSSSSSGSSSGPGGSSSSSGGDQCDVEQCPGVDTPCKYRACNGAECAFATPYGEVPGLDSKNPCIEIQCDGEGNQMEVAVNMEPDDGNACTTDVCLADGTPDHTQLPPNAVCKTGMSQKVEHCTSDGMCIECDDGNECTAEDCSSGSVVSTPEPIGTACGGNSGSECDGEGVCRGCKDPVTLQQLPEGTQCVDNAKLGTCDAVGTCVTWCQPLPDMATCPDNGPGEPNNNTQATAFSFGSISDSDGSGKLVCGVVKGADVDWYMYTGIDGFLSVVDRVFQAWSSDDTLKVCFYFQCLSGTASFTCNAANGEQASTAPNGAPGCCVEKTFSLGSYVGPGSSFDCTGVNDDDANVWMSVERVNGGACVPYALGFHY